MRKVDLLWQLQETDRQLDAARAAQARLSAEIGERSALARREAEVREAQERRHALEMQQRDLELLAEARRSKLEENERRLYSGRITNPKELSNLQSEIDQEKRQLSALEDQLLEIMEQLEELNARLTELRSLLERETEAWQSLQGRLKEQLRDTEATITQLTTQRSTLMSQLAPADQAVYETLRRQKGGVAVAQVHQRTCQACRVGLTPSQEQRARQGHDLVTCNSCGRILFVSLG